MLGLFSRIRVIGKLDNPDESVSASGSKEGPSQSKEADCYIGIQ